MPNPLHAFASWASETPNNWSNLAKDRALDAIIDTVAVMLPGRAEEVVEKLRPLTMSWGRGQIPAIGFCGNKKTHLSTPMAALLGGTMAHALDFDDNFDPAKAHASAVLVPALLAVAYERDLKGHALLDAYIVGLQIIGRVGQGVNPFHRSRGWHATATVGTVGAAAGIGRLIGLKPDTMAHAISLATSYAGGFMSQFGTMAKPMHAGIAAAGAVQAAEAAEAGISAGAHSLEGPHGMSSLMVGPDIEALRAAMQGKAEHGQTVRFATENIGSPLHIEAYGLKVKRFPNCGSIHRALDGLLALRSEHRFSADDVREILVRAPSAHLRNLMYDNPINSMQAKFSLEYSLAVGLLTGNAGLYDYSDPQIKNPAIRALMPLVKKEYVDALESEFPTEVHISLKNNAQHSIQIAMPVGSKEAPLSRAQLWDKYAGCVEGLLSPAQTKSSQKLLGDLANDARLRPLIDFLANIS